MPVAEAATVPTARAAAQVMAASAKTFNGAARLLPRRTRADVQLLYAFCRRVDDLADETGVLPAAGRAAAARRLHALAAELESAGDGPTARQLGWQFPDRGPLLPAAASALVRTLRTDLAQQQPPDADGLQAYAFGVAGTVGLMMANLLGADPRGLSAAIALGSAMQVTNIVRDVAADWRMGRVYLPASWIPAGQVGAALTHEDPAAEAALRKATLRALRLADALYLEALAGIWALPARTRWAILGAALCYREIGMAVARDIDASWRRRTVVSRGRKLSLLLKAGVRLLLPFYWRAPRTGRPVRNAEAAALRMCREQAAA